ncbi:hypothetical protein ACFQ1S_03935 [Kibdelosporangium lantanae]|uniref:Transcriptional regulator n=1 Tax=Kibdelosporangium lantanae TaxID=1497396 RepID=A0ABW3M2F8_9PSEU
MAIVQRWTGATANALQEAMRLTVREFAETIGVSPRAVTAWNSRGHDITPIPEIQRALDTALAQRTTEEHKARFWSILRDKDTQPASASADKGSGDVEPRFHQMVTVGLVDSQTAGAAVTDESAHNAAGEDPVEIMKRRTLMKFSLAAAAAITVGDSAIDQVGTTDVAGIKQTTARLHRLDQQHGGELIWQGALVAVSEAKRHLKQGSYTPDSRAAMQRAIGRLQVCAGWLCCDAGQRDQSVTNYMGALALARSTGDAEIETRAFANLAFQSSLLGQPDEALQFAGAAEMAARSIPDSSRVAAIPQLRLATASSLTGDAAETDRAITRARKALDDDRDHAAAPDWCTFLSPHEIDAVEAACAVNLGQASRAERLLEQAIDGYGDQHARNRALYRVRLAQARLDGRAVDGAVEAADAALDDLGPQLVSWRINAELAGVVDRLSQHPQVAGVDAFLHRYAAATR